MTTEARMRLWHQTDNAPRTPRRVSTGEPVAVEIGTWPVDPGQAVWVVVRSEEAEGLVTESVVDAAWQRNADGNSYGRRRSARSPSGRACRTPCTGTHRSVKRPHWAGTFVAGPKLHLALLWHQHQPLYRETGHPMGSERTEALVPAGGVMAGPQQHHLRMAVPARHHRAALPAPLPAPGA